jgi:hypothetical protein
MGCVAVQFGSQVPTFQNLKMQDAISFKTSIMWHDARKKEQFSLPGNDSVNTFPRQRIRKQQSSNFRRYATAL